MIPFPFVLEVMTCYVLSRYELALVALDYQECRLATIAEAAACIQELISQAAEVAADLQVCLMWVS